MKTIGFLRSDKENEKRIALVPEDIKRIKNKGNIFIENGYGFDCGYSNKDYVNEGANVATRNEIFNCDVLCGPKIGDSSYLKNLVGKTIFGWIHAVQNRDITDILINNKITAYAWEDMFESGRHVFWKNNEIAGEAAIMHAMMLYGIMPYDVNVAILGNGNVARGAYRVLTQLGANVNVYNRKMEALFRKELTKYDVIVNALLWDTTRKDHIIYKNDLKKMKRNSLIIDISCDRSGAIETSIPTSIEKPMYKLEGVNHYVVDHTPSLFYKSVSKELSRACVEYLDDIIEDKENLVLKNCLCIKDGKIMDKRIIDFQKR